MTDIRHQNDHLSSRMTDISVMDFSHNSSRERGAKSLMVGKKKPAKPETAPEQCGRSVLSGAFSLLLVLCGVSAGSRLSLRLGN